jgi:hypothetical protein
MTPTDRARLSDSFHYDHTLTRRDLCDRLALKADEVERLHELVRIFYHCTTSGECDECPINGGGKVRLMPDTICDTIHNRINQLGIEIEASSPPM